MLPADAKKIVDGLQEMKVFIEGTAKMQDSLKKMLDEAKRQSEERWDSPEAIRAKKMHFMSQLILEAFVEAVKGKAPLANIVGMAATVTEEVFRTAVEHNYLPAYGEDQRND